MDAFLAFSHRLKEAVYSAVGWVASAMLLVLTLFALVEIVRRYIFSVVFEWGQDAIIVGMVSAVAIYFGVTQVRRGHLMMHAVVQWLYSRGHLKTVAILRLVTSVTILVFCFAVGISGWSTFGYAWDRDLSTYSLIIPLWPFYLILMFGFLFTAFIALLQLIEDILGFMRGDYIDADIEVTTDV